MRACPAQGKAINNNGGLNREMKNHRETAHPNVSDRATTATMATRELRLTLSVNVTQVWKNTGLAKNKTHKSRTVCLRKDPFGLGLVIPPLVHSVPRPSIHTQIHNVYTQRPYCPVSHCNPLSGVASEGQPTYTQ